MNDRRIALASLGFSVCTLALVAVIALRPPPPNVDARAELSQVVDRLDAMRSDIEGILALTETPDAAPSPDGAIVERLNSLESSVSNLHLRIEEMNDGLERYVGETWGTVGQLCELTPGCVFIR